MEFSIRRTELIFAASLGAACHTTVIREVLFTKTTRDADLEGIGKATAFQRFTDGKGERARLERVKGIEPSPQAWEARILPLNHTRTIWCYP